MVCPSALARYADGRAEDSRKNQSNPPNSLLVHRVRSVFHSRSFHLSPIASPPGSGVRSVLGKYASTSESTIINSSTICNLELPMAKGARPAPIRHTLYLHCVIHPYVKCVQSKSQRRPAVAYDCNVKLKRVRGRDRATEDRQRKKNGERLRVSGIDGG